MGTSPLRQGCDRLKVRIGVLLDLGCVLTRCVPCSRGLKGEEYETLSRYLLIWKMKLTIDFKENRFKILFSVQHQGHVSGRGGRSPVRGGQGAMALRCRYSSRQKFQSRDQGRQSGRAVRCAQVRTIERCFRNSCSIPAVMKTSIKLMCSCKTSLLFWGGKDCCLAFFFGKWADFSVHLPY